jgi:hypothetical protein
MEQRVVVPLAKFLVANAGLRKKTVKLETQNDEVVVEII